MEFSFFLLLMISSFPYLCMGHASNMILSANCNRELVEGADVMDNGLVLSTAKEVVISRNSVTLASPSTYSYSENLIVSLSGSSTNLEYLFQSENGLFLSGANRGCSGRRYHDGPATLTMPSSGNKTVTVIVVWSSAYSDAKISQEFILTSPSSTNTTNTFSPTSSSTNDSNQLSSLGIILGIAGCLFVFLLIFLFSGFNSSYETVSLIFGMVSVAASLTGIGLVVSWAKDSDTETGYLGVPSWNNNLLAWHPVLMVGGFYTAQVLAITSWGFIKYGALAKLSHVLFNIAGAVSMAIGLSAIIHYINDVNANSLTTMHSWIGCAAIGSFGFTFLWGLFMATITKVAPDSKLSSYISWLPIHKVFGVASVLLTVLATVTGIMDQLPFGTCYDSSSTESTYSSLSVACKLGNGLGIVIVFSCFFLILSMIYRAKALSSDAIKSNKTIDERLVVNADSVATNDDVVVVSNDDNKLAFNIEPENFNKRAKPTAKIDDNSVGPVWTLCAIVSVILSFIGIGLVVSWAKDKDTDSETGYLGVPSWSNNPLAWHPVLMVGGFYTAQVLAITSWGFIKYRALAKLSHVLFNTAGLISVAIGVLAAVHYLDDHDGHSLTTLHSWIGSAAVSSFGCTFLWGLVMGIITKIAPDSKLHSYISWLPIHKVFGVASVLLTVLATATGIMNQLPLGTCYESSNTDTNYSSLYDACKLANGLGIAIICSSFFLFGAVLCRNNTFFSSSIPSQQKVVVAKYLQHSI